MATSPRLTEEEIRPDRLKEEQSRRYAEDVAWLNARRDRFVDIDCPCCGEANATQIWAKLGLAYVECTACETVYVDPRPDPGLLADYYQNSQNNQYWNDIIFPASEDARREKLFKPRAERVVEIAKRNDSKMRTLVDVGAGFGTFCEEVTKLGVFERVIAIEPEPHFAETCRRKGLEVIQAPVELADIPVDEVDVVTSFEVIEHLFSPREFLERCAQIVPTGGVLVVTCPNVKGFDVVVLGDDSMAVDTEHLNYMHPASLGSLLEQVGFDVLERQTPGKLDAELVRKAALAGQIDLSTQPFLEQVLLDEWDRLGEPFQDFLAENGLSSHMWLVARAR